MSQLSDWRRKTPKKSQQALSKELGYEKWTTYAAQERGENPLPEDVKAKLERKYKYAGLWPDQEASTDGGVTRDEFEELRDDLEDACAVIQFLLSQVPEGSRPGVLPKRFRAGATKT